MFSLSAVPEGPVGQASRPRCAERAGFSLHADVCVGAHDRKRLGRLCRCIARPAMIRVIPLVPPPLPGGGICPVDFVIASTAEPQQVAEIADRLVQSAYKSGLFIFADTDVKFDQPQAEVVFNRDQVRSQGVNLSQTGADLSTRRPRDDTRRAERRALLPPRSSSSSWARSGPC